MLEKSQRAHKANSSARLSGGNAVNTANSLTDVQTANLTSAILQKQKEPEGKLETVKIYPRPKFLYSMRHNTLSNEQAIDDLIDNCLDVDVDASRIDIYYKKDEYIALVDNGSGMNYKILEDAMKLGSAGRHRPNATDLGLYGIGLKNSATSLGKRLVVVTKSANNNHYTAIYDIEEIVERGEFEIPIYESSSSEITLFNSYTNNSDHGTVLLISKLDRIAIPGERAFTNALVKNIGETFRVYITDGKEIYVNNTKVRAIEPLAGFGDYQTEINDQEYEFQRPDGSPFTIRIKFGFLPNLSEKTDKNNLPLNISMENQGIYIMRNNRQLERATWLKLRTPHNQINRVRAEMFITGETDDVFFINFEKNKIQLHQWFKDKLWDKIKGIVSSYEDRAKLDKRTNQATDDETAKELLQIKQDIDSRASRIAPLRTKNKKTTNETTTENSRTKNVVQNNPQEEVVAVDRPSSRRELITFDHGNLELSYICHFEDTGNGSVKIRWNVNHVFYSYFNSLQKDTKTAFTKLLLSMGRAILYFSNETEDYARMMNDFQIRMGDELRKLMD
jgi:hypothetical protein